ncbi:laminin subunit gamma-3 [Clupea harengus]|uniref:Laminin subunit gamma-3 n=1 Tax=Clupea harengus TaxID=7950 RepID=A0A8M1KMS1_CLUHA|nr:laminin subunit gamma-3 [Clupea harengus]
MGSVSMQCHGNGTCPCRQGFVGYKCDKCELNYFQNRDTHQCEECPVCYSLIRDQAAKLKARMQALEKVLSSITCTSSAGTSILDTSRMKMNMNNTNWRNNLVREHRDEDYLPNSLEDFLAIQEAREAFIRQFTQLETSAQTLELHLRSVAMVMNCSLREEEGGMEREEERERQKNERRTTKECVPLMETYAAVRGVQAQLEQATHDLGNMVIPFSIPKGPNEWNAAVNESHILTESHVEAANRMESMAAEALRVSNQTYTLLLKLLEDNSTQVYIQGLTQRLSDMQQRNLSSQVNQSLEAYLTLTEQQDEAAAILKNLSTNASSLSLPLTESSPNTNQTNETAKDELFLTQVLSLQNRTLELDVLLQSKEELLNKTREELETGIKEGQKNIKTIQEFQQLTDLAEGLKVASLSSVVKAKEVESEASSLRRNLEGMQKEWPRKQAQTKAAVRKARVVEERVLTEAKKKTKIAERVVQAAVKKRHASQHHRHPGGGHRQHRL